MTAQPSSSLADTGFFVVVYSESGKVEQAFSLGLPEIEPRVRVRRDRRAKRSRCPRPCRRVCRPRRRWRDDASDSDDEDIDDEDIDDDIETPRRPDTPASPDTQPNAKVTSDTAGNIIVAVRRFTVWVLTKYDPLGSMLWRTFITTSEAGESAPGTGIPTDLQAFDLTTNIHQEIVCCGEYNTSPVFRNANTDISPVRLAPSSTVGSYLVAFGCDGNVRWVSKQLAKSANTQPSIQAQTLTIDNYQRIFTGSIFKGNPLHLFASDGTVALRVEGMSTQAAVIIAYEEFSQILSMAGSINRPLTKTVELIGTNNSRTLIVNDPEQGAIADKTGNRLSSLVLAGSGATMTLSWINCRWYVTASNQVDLIY
ncbi:Hypothetical protein MVR_LOCUS225 [uncultured virus]|nr:Hypothetical protein MVR_LOCUS225 [uncultured virus]